MKHRYMVIPLLLALTFLGCKSVNSILKNVQKPSASLSSVHFGDANLESVTLIFDVEIRNPYSVNLPLLGIEYSLDSDGTMLLTGVSESETVLAKKGQQVVPLYVEIPHLELVKAFKNFRPGDEIPYHAWAKLKFQAPIIGPTTVPIQKQGTLAVPKLSDLKNVDWKGLIEKLDRSK